MSDLSPSSESLVDVLIPCAGSARYLEATLRSVLAQTFKAWRVTVLDNACEHDRCNEIVLALSDPRVRCVRFDQRLPAILNWNRCLSYARAPLFAFLHDDDVWLPWHLERAVERLSISGEASAYLGAHAPFSDSEPAGVKAELAASWRFLADLDADDLITALAASPWVHMSALVARRGGPTFDPVRAWNADQAFCFAQALSGPLLVEAEVSVFIRQHPENDTRNFSSARASVATLELMRHSMRQLIAVGRLRPEFFVQNTTHLTSGGVFRLLQCSYSWPPDPGLRALGAALLAEPHLRRQASAHSSVARLLALAPRWLWPLATLLMDYTYFRRMCAARACK